MFICALLFYPNQANPARASGRGVWRVWSCVKHQPADARMRVAVRSGMMFLRTTRAYKPRSRVDPARMLFTPAAEKLAA
jgi:hypothetical protein